METKIIFGCHVRILELHLTIQITNIDGIKNTNAGNIMISTRRLPHFKPHLRKVDGLFIFNLSLRYLSQFFSLLIDAYFFPLDLVCFLYSSCSTLYCYWCPRLNAYSFTFISSLFCYDAFTFDCDRFMPDGLVFPDYSSTTVDKFCSSFHVINHMKTWTTLESTATATATATATTTVLDHYTSLHPSSASYKRILLEARSMVPLITDCNEFIPLSNPAVFASSRLEELPIVIDTGASCSITPVCSDFIEDLSTPDITSLGSLTSMDTAVVGRERVLWDVEDFHGTRQSITTKSYLVPSGTI